MSDIAVGGTGAAFGKSFLSNQKLARALTSTPKAITPAITPANTSCCLATSGTNTAGSVPSRRQDFVRPRLIDYNSSSRRLCSLQAQTTLKPPSNLIAPAVYTQSESTRKNEFLVLVDTIGLKVCAGQGTGSPAVFAETSMVSMRAETRNFDGIGSTTIDMSCSGCTPAKMKLGSSLEGKYNSWSCATGETCSGACLLSTQV